MQPAKATLSPLAANHEGRLSGGAIAGIVIGAVLGAGALMALAWLGMREYRRWKARKNQHMKGVELQRRWETEQDVRREMEEIDGGDGA
ncbi:MAG: hypothetical protein L6R39_007119 [Caloplaca ligustica]|nr:MAG: hypothetical protein L6R39_007119 [Caloplaca ligustica]